MDNKFNNPDVGIDFEFEEISNSDKIPAEVTQPADPLEPIQLVEPVEPEDTKEPETPVASEVDKTKKEESIEKIKTGVEFKEEEEEKGEEEEDRFANNVYLKTINNLADKGFITDAQFEGFDPDADPTEETLTKLLEHNFALKQEETIQSFYERLNPITQRIVSLDLDAGDPEVIESYLRTLNQENEIKSLNPENEFDQEQIVRTWYKKETAGGKSIWTDEEIESRIKDLRESGLLEKEATGLKPKLDLKAEQIAKETEATQAALKEIENKRKAAYYERVNEVLSKGEVGGMKLDDTTLKEIYSTMIMDEVPIKLPEGREIKMPLLEALIFHHKYNPKGDIEVLAMVAYHLKNPKKFKEQFAKMASTEVTNNFVREQKYSSAIKTTGDQKQKAREKVNVPWNFKVN